jgi:hypothetical protein
MMVLDIMRPTPTTFALAVLLLFLLTNCRSDGDHYTIVKREKVQYADLSGYHDVFVLEHDGVRITSQACTRWYAKGKKPTIENPPAEGFDSYCEDLPVGKPLEMTRRNGSLLYLYSEDDYGYEIVLGIDKEEKL